MLLVKIDSLAAEPSTSGRLQILSYGKEDRFAPLLTIPPEAVV